MPVQDLNQNAFIDLFADQNQQQSQNNQPITDNQGARFGGHQIDVDLLKDTNKDNSPDNQQDSDQNLEVDKGNLNSDDKDADIVDPKKSVDILSDDDKKNQQSDEEKNKLEWVANYYQQRVKEGKFIAVNNINDKGEKVPFVPSTLDDFDEILEMQMDHKLQEAKKNLDLAWYESKTPAWKAVAQYAEMVDDPSQLIPFIQGVKTIQSVVNIDENEIDGAEAIVRIRLEQRGDPEEAIESQIKALKTTDELIKTAKAYKPVIVQQEQKQLAEQVKEEKQREQYWMNTINTIRQNTYKALEEPIFGKQKLKNEEKAAIYDLIGEPREQTQGYGIYNEIDKLFDNNDFETLKQIALLLTKKDAFYTYLGADIANKTAAGLQRKLQLSTESNLSSGNDYDVDTTPTVTKNKYKKSTVRFGR